MKITLDGDSGELAGFVLAWMKGQQAVESLSPREIISRALEEALAASAREGADKGREL